LTILIAENAQLFASELERGRRGHISARTESGYSGS
jgi:hypothetical protein